MPNVPPAGVLRAAIYTCGDERTQNRNPLGPVRAEVADRFRRLLAGGHEPAELAEWVTDVGDDGLFGPDSVAWRVHGELATLIGGLRALMLQTLHPLAMAGVADHSAFRTDPFGRLQRTAGFLAATVFGTTDDAERAIATVRRVHRHVRGTAPDGRPYSASDPHLVTFVHVTEVDSFLAAHQVYGRSRLLSDADRYVGEMAASPPPRRPRRARGRGRAAGWLDVRPRARPHGAGARRGGFLLVPPLPSAPAPPSDRLVGVDRAAAPLGAADAVAAELPAGGPAGRATGHAVDPRRARLGGAGLAPQGVGPPAGRRDRLTPQTGSFGGSSTIWRRSMRMRRSIRDRYDWLTPIRVAISSCPRPRRSAAPRRPGPLGEPVEQAGDEHPLVDQPELAVDDRHDLLAGTGPVGGFVRTSPRSGRRRPPAPRGRGPRSRPTRPRARGPSASGRASG